MPPTTYHLRNESGIEVFTGSIFPAPGGGSQPGAVKVVEFSFAFDDAGLTDGIAAYTPVVGERLLDGWFEIDTAWDGTTPRGDFGTFSGTGGLLYNYGADATDMTRGWRDMPDNSGLWCSPSPAVVAQADLQNNIINLAIENTAADDGPPWRFTATNPIKVVVSQDGQKGSASPGSMQGAARLCLRISTVAA